MPDNSIDDAVRQLAEHDTHLRTLALCCADLIDEIIRRFQGDPRLRRDPVSGDPALDNRHVFLYSDDPDSRWAALFHIWAPTGWTTNNQILAQQYAKFMEEPNYWTPVVQLDRTLWPSNAATYAQQWRDTMDFSSASWTQLVAKFLEMYGYFLGPTRVEYKASKNLVASHVLGDKAGARWYVESEIPSLGVKAWREPCDPGIDRDARESLRHDYPGVFEKVFTQGTYYPDRLRAARNRAALHLCLMGKYLSHDGPTHGIRKRGIDSESVFRWAPPSPMKLEWLRANPAANQRYAEVIRSW